MGHNGEVASEFEWIGFLAVQPVKKCVFILPTTQLDFTTVARRCSAEQATRSTVRCTLGVDLCVSSVNLFLFVVFAQFSN